MYSLLKELGITTSNNCMLNFSLQVESSLKCFKSHLIVRQPMVANLSFTAEAITFNQYHTDLYP